MPSNWSEACLVPREVRWWHPEWPGEIRQKASPAVAILRRDDLLAALPFSGWPKTGWRCDDVSVVRGRAADGAIAERRLPVQLLWQGRPTCESCDEPFPSRVVVWEPGAEVHCPFCG